jgi:hypothetical protein
VNLNARCREPVHSSPPVVSARRSFQRLAGLGFSGSSYQNLGRRSRISTPTRRRFHPKDWSSSSLPPSSNPHCFMNMPVPLSEPSAVSSPSTNHYPLSTVCPTSAHAEKQTPFPRTSTPTQFATLKVEGGRRANSRVHLFHFTAFVPHDGGNGKGERTFTNLLTNQSTKLSVSTVFS